MLLDIMLCTATPAGPSPKGQLLPKHWVETALGENHTYVEILYLMKLAGLKRSWSAPLQQTRTKTITTGITKHLKWLILAASHCRYGIEEPYEKLKVFTRGQQMTEKGMREFVDSLHELPAEAKQSLAAMTPASYIGNARQQAEQLPQQLQSLQ